MEVLSAATMTKISTDSAFDMFGGSHILAGIFTKVFSHQI